MSPSEIGALDRPFYFIIVVWGERFRDYFLSLCLPTLLSPRNLPCLATRQRSKFLICTRPEDWAAMKAAPIFQAMERYVDPVYLEIPPWPAGVLACMHMGIGHRRACELAHEAKAYSFVLTPDSLFSDGTVERLQELAVQGVELVLAPALRFAQEPLFGHLREMGISPSGRNAVAEPITIGNRELARIALASMHSETKTYEWDAPYFHPTPSAAWWRVPGEDGIVVHCLSWAPLLLDFAAVPEHDTSTLDDWTIDGDYIYKNLSAIERIHLVLDSDEIFMASWAPLSDRPHDLRPRSLLATAVIGSLIKQQRFNGAFYSGDFDPLKQRIFFETIRWHARSLNETWASVEKDALGTLGSCVAPPSEAKNVLEKFTGNNRLSAIHLHRSQLRLRWSKFRIHCLRLANVLLMPATRCMIILRWVWSKRGGSARRMERILHGDRVAWKRARWRIRQGTHFLLGQRFNEPEPKM